LYSKWNIHSKINLCLQAVVKEKIRSLEEQLNKLKEEQANFQVSFISIGNVTMVFVFIENSQIQNAVDLQRCMSCEMQLNFVVNVHVAVTISTFQCNKKCISLSEHPVYQRYIVDIYIHKRTHMALSPVQHTVQTHFTFHIVLQTHFTLNWTLCEDHTSNSDISVQKHKSCLNCAQLCNLPLEIRFKISFKCIQSLSASFCYRVCDMQRNKIVT